jgi:enoyl-CoA hydratase/carnithine racemase
VTTGSAQAESVSLRVHPVNPVPTAQAPGGPAAAVGVIAEIVLDRPAALNALSTAMLAALARACDQVAADGEVRAVLLTAAGERAFCVGADLKERAAMTDEQILAQRPVFRTAFGALLGLPQPVIAAVHGYALGGGCELAMACDLRIAGDSASFGQPEINLGIIPGFGGTQRLPRLVGRARALELNLVGDAIGAAQALDYGLVNRVVVDHELLDTSLAWARKLAGQAPLAVAEIKRVAAADDLSAGIAAEKDAFVSVFDSDDAREGIAAFVAKRAPHWNRTPARP